MGVVLGIDRWECTIQYLDDNKVEYGVHIDDIRIIQDEIRSEPSSSRELQTSAELPTAIESTEVKKKSLESKKTAPISQAVFAALYKEFTVRTISCFDLCLFLYILIQNRAVGNQHKTLR
jgi:hypothetical protein